MPFESSVEDLMYKTRYIVECISHLHNSIPDKNKKAHIYNLNMKFE
jgi:hypothetical protein